ncbi:MAG: helix-turn-helix transcriptional regulator [Arenicella sp.]
MRQNLPSHYKEIADDMGISLYQRFSLDDASDFLHCSISEIEELRQQGNIDYIKVAQDNIQFFGYQLLAHLLDNTTSNKTVHQHPIDHPDKIIRDKEVQGMTGLSRTTIWRKEKKGEFPKRVPLGKVSVGWKLSEVQNWIAQRQ